MAQKVFDRFNRKESLWMLGLVGAYLLWTGLVVGLRSDHVFFALFCLAAWFAHPVSRKVLLCLVFFILYWLLYDSSRIYPNYLVNPVHIAEPYELEKAWFGISTPQGVLTPNEFFQTHTHPFLDVLSAVFYLMWVPVPVGFAVWLYFKDRFLLLEFSFAFFLLNAIGLLIYYLYPAAPPWYVEEYGFAENFDILGQAAGLANVDALLGVDFFKNMYEKNANVFAAIPSLHSAFPLITLLYGWKKGLRWGNVFFFVVCLGIWFAAVYTRHHYILDVLLGILCAVLSYVLMEKVLLKMRFRNWLLRYADFIQKI